MKRTTQLGALCVVAGLALGTTALAQDDASSAQSQQQTTTKQTTQVTDDGVARTTTTTTVQGKVVRYEPGKTIVVLGSDNKQMTYTLATDINAPSDVQIGKEVSLSMEPGENGAVLVHRITTRSVTSDGKIKSETQTKTIDAQGNTSSMTSTSITGTVSAFEPGKSITIQLPDQKTVVYTIDASSVVPADVSVGKTYTIQTTRTSANGPLVVRKITTTTTTKKTDVQ